MGNNDTEFTPEQVEHQIDLLAQAQGGRSDAPSDARLISDLSHIYTKNNATVERAWQRLSTQVESTRPLPTVGNGPSQRRWQPDVLPERRERPQGMEIKATNKRPPRPITRFLETCAAILVVVALVAGTVFLLNNAHQMRTTSTTSKSSGLYVGTPDGVSHRDLTSGNVLWNYHANTSSGVFVTDDVVVFQINASSGDLVGVDAATGRQLWTQTSVQPSALENVSDGVVIVSTYYVSRTGGTHEPWVSTLTAYQATTGQQLWSYKPTPPSNPQSVSSVANQFAFANGVFYLGSVVERLPDPSPSTLQVVALKLSSGTPLWHKTFDNSNVLPWLVTDGNSLYIVTGKMIHDIQRYECFAINGANGKQIWRTDIIGNTNDYNNIPFSPTVANGVLYIDGTGRGYEYAPHIYAYSTSNGALLKSYTLGSQDGFNFPPLVVQGLIFYDRSAGNGPGVYYTNLVALDIKTEKPAWSVSVGPTSALEPQIVNDIIYTPGGDKLFAYSVSGKLLHSYQMQTSPDARWTFTVVA